VKILSWGEFKALNDYETAALHRGDRRSVSIDADSGRDLLTLEVNGDKVAVTKLSDALVGAGTAREITYYERRIRNRKGKVMNDTDTRPVAVARTTDPETSHEAAASVRNLTTRQFLILDIFRFSGPQTDEELIERYDLVAFDTPQSPSGIRTRRAELVAAGKVRFSGAYRYTAANRRTRVWEIAPSKPALR